MPLNKHGLVRNCLGELYSDRVAFSARFYDKLFAQLPQVQRLFVHDRKKQELMLYSTISMTMRGMEKGRELDAELMEFGRRHARIGVREEFFPVFGAVFLETLIEFLPDWDHPQVASAWWGGYSDVCEIMVAGMRAERAEMDKGRRVFGSGAGVAVDRASG